MVVAGHRGAGSPAAARMSRDQLIRAAPGGGPAERVAPPARSPVGLGVPQIPERTRSVSEPYRAVVLIGNQ